MQRVTVELIDDKIVELLRQLEKLRLLRLVEVSSNPTTPNRNWAGSISASTAEKMLHHTDTTRDEWDRI